MHGSDDELDFIDDAADELEIVDDAAAELDIVDGFFRTFRADFCNLSIFLETHFFTKRFHLALKKHIFIYRGFIYELPNKKRFFSENRFFQKT